MVYLTSQVNVILGSSTFYKTKCMLRIQIYHGHKLLNFLLHEFVKNVSTCRSLQDLYTFRICDAQGLAKLQVFASHPPRLPPSLRGMPAASLNSFSLNNF